MTQMLNGHSNIINTFADEIDFMPNLSDFLSGHPPTGHTLIILGNNILKQNNQSNYKQNEKTTKF